MVPPSLPLILPGEDWTAPHVLLGGASKGQRELGGAAFCTGREGDKLAFVSTASKTACVLSFIFLGRPCFLDNATKIREQAIGVSQFHASSWTPCTPKLCVFAYLFLNLGACGAVMRLLSLSLVFPPALAPSFPPLAKKRMTFAVSFPDKGESVVPSGPLGNQGSNAVLGSICCSPARKESRRVWAGPEGQVKQLKTCS